MADAAQRRAYLQAMGVQPWVRRELDASVTEAEVAPVAASAPPAVEKIVEVVAKETAVPASVEANIAQSPSVASPDVGSAVSTDQAAPSETGPRLSPAVSLTTPSSEPTTAISTLDWDALQTSVAQCTACELHATRNQTVFGSGNRNADWMIIGEAPGEEEDRQGEPFIGRAGQLLNNMLRATGLSREQVYIANVIKCHPPGDRNPHVDEISQCFGYLQRQIELVQPKLILVVGRVAAHALLKVNAPLGDLRGQVHRFADVPLVVTYHPAYLLRKPSEKAKSWSDLRLARRVVVGDQA